MLYASESDLSDSDEDEEEVAATTGKRRGGDFATRLRLDDDEPMDLLSGAAPRFTSKQHPLLSTDNERNHKNTLKVQKVAADPNRDKMLPTSKRTKRQAR